VSEIVHELELPNVLAAAVVTLVDWFYYEDCSETVAVAEVFVDRGDQLGWTPAVRHYMKRVFVLHGYVMFC